MISCNAFFQLLHIEVVKLKQCDDLKTEIDIDRWSDFQHYGVINRFFSSALCDEIVTKIPLAGLSPVNHVRWHDSEHRFIKIQRQF